MKAGRNTPSTALLSLTWSDVLFYSFIFVCVYVNKNSRVYTIFITNFFKQFHCTRPPHLSPRHLIYFSFLSDTHTHTKSQYPSEDKCSSHIRTVEGSQHIVIKLLPSMWCAVGLYEKVGRGQAVITCMHADMCVLFTHFWLLRSRSEISYWHDTTVKYQHRFIQRNWRAALKLYYNVQFVSGLDINQSQHLHSASPLLTANTVSKVTHNILSLWCTINS